jgi:Zn-dependent metalloprotease
MATCCIVPPYLIEKLIERGIQLRAAGAGADTLQIDQRFRSQRAQLQRYARPAGAPTTRGIETDDPAAGRRWSVHTAAGTETLPGDTVLEDGGAETSNDPAANEAFDGVEATWDLLEAVFSYRSYDNAGSEVVATVHYGTNYDNAFWNGEQLVCGDGDQQVFDRFTKSIDVLGHELGHGVTQFTSKLEYSGQPGALNESVSDVIGSMVKQRKLGQSADLADWLIGEGLFMPSVNGVALRSLKAPGTAYDDPQLGKDPQPATMSGYVDTLDDNGGVHINSGIPNRAFYLAATAIGGNSWEGMGPIWWQAITGGGVTDQTDFAGFAQATIDAATELKGADSDEAKAVRDAWAQVEVISPTSAAGESPSPSTDSGSPNPEKQRVYVRRTGGFAGVAREGEIDLADHPRGSEVADLLNQVDLRGLPESEPHPDQFQYAVRTPHHEVRVGERDLTPELAQIVHIVLED